VVTKGNFFADVTFRHDQLDMNVTNAVAGLSNTPFRGHANNINSSAGYHFELGNNYFVEPSAGMSWTRSVFDLLPIGGSAGFLQFDTQKSTLGRIGVRAGTSTVIDDKISLQPFVSFSYWNEFEKDANANAILQGVPTPLTATRVGSFFQASGGMAFSIINTGAIGFVRGDWRKGDNIEGYTVLGGLRYTFGPY
jgi:outer membrane autotransporter protein